jgi:uncharacterized oligopeptide transporter (OPT) family protein
MSFVQVVVHRMAIVCTLMATLGVLFVTPEHGVMVKSNNKADLKQL